MLTIEHHSSVVRSGRLALPIPDWQTGALLLRHERMKLGPCRASAAGWLHSDPIGQSELRSRIENRRFLKENGRPDGIRTRIPRLERPESSLLDDKADGALTSGTSESHSEPAAGHSQKENTRPASPFNASGAPRVGAEPHSGGSAFRKKEHTPSSLSAE